MVAKIRPLARKSGCPMCAPSIASFIPSAIRRNCLAFIYAFIPSKVLQRLFPVELDRSVDAGLLAQEHEDGNEHCKDGYFDQKPRNHNPRPMNVFRHVARIYKEMQSLVLQKIDW